MSQAAQLERYLFDHRLCSRIFTGEAEPWNVASSSPGFSERSLKWTSSPFPDGVEILRDLPSDVINLVLVGMGGATLSASAFACTEREGVDRTLRVLDSTSPEFLAPHLSASYRPDIHYVVASKSGETPETLAIARSLLSRVNCTDSFTVITDPDNSSLRDWASRQGIRVYSSDPFVTGRFTALTNLALIPVAMLGIDIERLKKARDEFAAEMAGESGVAGAARQLAAALALACTSEAGETRISASQSLLPVARWIEQIVAESLSKSGHGVLPAVAGIDRDADCSTMTSVRFRVGARAPGTGLAIEERIANSAQLARLFLLWQSAVTMAAFLMEINPYDQPEVDSAKRVSLLPANSELPDRETRPIRPYRHQINPDADDCEQSAAAYLDHLDASLCEHDYIAILAFVNPAREVETELAGLASHFESLYRHRQVCAVYSFGPQYLHSTGQFFKATAKAHLASLPLSTPESIAAPDTYSVIESVRQPRKNAFRTGHFLYVEAAERADFDIAGEPYTFAQMIRQQARMDAQYMMSVCLSETTPSLINCGADIAQSLQRLSAALRRTQARAD